MPYSLVCILISACLVLSGQASAPQAVTVQGQAGAARSATVSGRVLRAGSRVPIADAGVQLTSTRFDGPSVQMLTDKAGAFAFEGVAPGRYVVAVSKPGYPAGSTIAGRGANSRRLTVVANEILDNLEFLLNPGSAITGRVIDNEGEPVIRATVLALRRLRANHQTVLWPVGASVTSDDQGRYRLSDIPPGSYLVRVTPPATLLPGLPVATRSGSGDRPAVRVETYYPGASSLDQAQAVTVSPNYEAAGSDVVMQAVRAFAVRGAVPGAQETTASGSVFVYLESVEGSGVGRRSAAASREGKFELSGVPPGRYTVRSSARDAAKKESLWFATVDVVDRDVADLILPLLPAVDIHGSVVVDTSARDSLDPALAKSLKVDVRPGYNPLASGHEAAWEGGNKFAVSSVFAGAPYTVVVRDLPHEYYRVGVSYGDTDAMEENIVVTPGRTLDVRLGKGAASLSVQVKDGDGNAFAQAYVLLVKEGELRAGVWRWQAGIVADQHGVVEFWNLAPARYRLYAFDSFDTSLLAQSGGLLRFDGGATKLELGAAESRHIEAKVMQFNP